jgi:hypothetical protein
MLVTPEIISLPKSPIGEVFLNPETGKFHNRFEGDAAEDPLRVLHSIHSS